MSQSNDEAQQCFIPAHWQQASIQTNRDQDVPYLNINKLLEQAKQLHNRSRPKLMVPRTCFLQLPLKRLPQYLQQCCTQLQQPVGQQSTFAPLQNPEHLSFSSFFQPYEVVYNKMKMYSRPTFQLSQPTSRFKEISHLFDFHGKLFKELYSNQLIKSPIYVSINDQFDSMFQCGNLGLVYKKEDSLDRQYFLILENDTNSHGYTSWFFFKVKSCGRGRASFHILNLSKSPYLYRIGQRISIFSVHKYHQNKTRWFKGGQNIQTYSTQFEKRAGGDTYSCIYFQYNFEESESEVYFSMSRPYTYSMMIKQINNIEQQICQQQNPTVNFQAINSLYSISCNIIPVIVLSSSNSSRKQTLSVSNISNININLNDQDTTNDEYFQLQNVSFSKKKKAIVFMARQHPGEVVGSYFMHQIIEKFRQKSDEMTDLLQKYTFVIIPMVNPDGVIHGNSRCNLSGLDLNRQWMKQCSKLVTPQTFYLRKFLWELQQNIGIQYLIDLHGHSKKMNSFFFCNKMNEIYPSQYLPYMISKINKRFDMNSCTFNTTADKKNTLRNQLFEFGMKNCMTVENSYFGFWEDKVAKLFKDVDFREMADSLIKVLHFMLVEDSQKELNLSQIYGFSKDDINNQVKVCKQYNAKKTNKTQANEDIESESDPEADIMKPQQMQKIFQTQQNDQIKKQPQKKKTRPRKPKPAKKQEVQKQVQIRISEPMRKYKELQSTESKAHNSQKKLEISITNKKSITQQKFKQASKIMTTFQQKKQSVKKQEVIKQKIMSMDENESGRASKQQKQIKTRGKIYGTSFYKSNYDSYLNKGTLSRRIQSRLRTDEGQKNKIQREVTTNFGNYGQIKQERLKMFLNQTLSISKVENQGMVSSSGLDVNRRKNSLKSEKYLQRPTRVHTQQQANEKKILQIDNSPNGKSIAKEKEERKKFLSRNYKRQLVRRKKILSTQQAGNKKYKRFETFVENQQKNNASQNVKPECNSVFYYFPVL